ncbi:MAG: HAD-IIB family hydrolase [Candidatus Diapherotrites archaeon]|uniref:HAD-IIB family hydrolase n=1 Tax=Candidatus Iainarchaeum sp. TaxID=3101447 RepID=A0A8T3YRY9_9ARCH|nr:HAD-IIB family hydrolase [Candidatus Diapherotrites archaeon]
MPQKLLATDLDGTLFGLRGSRANASCLRKLGQALLENSVRLVFVTGRHIELALSAIEEHSLPLPCSIVCNVGTEIFFMDRKGGWRKDPEWEKYLSRKAKSHGFGAVSRALGCVEGATEQEREKQGQFKRSYYMAIKGAPSALREMRGIIRRKKIGARIIYSADPQSMLGLADVLPKGTSKKSAVEFLRRKWGIGKACVIAAGDSGNDAQLLSGYSAIVVGNAMPDLRAALGRGKPSKMQGRYFARRPCACGVLEGMKHFLGVA